MAPQIHLFSLISIVMIQRGRVGPIGKSLSFEGSALINGLVSYKEGPQETNLGFLCLLTCENSVILQRMQKQH